MIAVGLQKPNDLAGIGRPMMRFRDLFSRAKYPALVCGSLALLIASACVPKEQPARVSMFPRLQAGQTLAYQVSYHSEKNIKTQSTVIVAAPGDSAKIDVNALLRLDVVSVQARGDRAIIHARTTFEVLNSDSHLKVPQIEPPDPQLQGQDPKGKVIEFTILPTGRLDQVTGLDGLFPEQRQAWQEWASRFLLAAEFRTPSVHIAQKWNSVETERSPAPIAGLRWIRESTYVRDEPCRAVQLTVQGSVAPSDAEPEPCAVILTNATLRQDSNANNATPEDFKLHELRTAGTARGSNRIITYVSLKSGLVIRATEESTQQMDVTVAKADGSNRVRYGVNAKSHSEVVLVVQTPLNPQSSP
jgi:hypothetical protein